MVLSRIVTAGILATTLVSGCGQETFSTIKTPVLSEQQANEDLDAIVSQVRRLYGPLKFKEERFGFTLDEIVAEAKSDIASGTSDAERLGALVRFLNKFEDGHVGIRIPGNASTIRGYKIPIFVTPVEGKAVVEWFDETLANFGLARGDVLVSIDGKTPAELLPAIKKYQMMGNDVSDEHLIHHVLSRPFYMTELTPTEPLATLVLERADGSTYTISPLWKKELDDPKPLDPVGLSRLDYLFSGAADFNESAQGSVMKFGAFKPYFLTKESVRALNVVEVEPNETYLAKYGVTKADLTNTEGFAIYSALYRYEGKTILLVRQPGYSLPLDHDKLIKGYKAIFDQFDDLADVLILDQTHNPGGSIAYLTNFYQLFVQDTKPNMVQFMNADRRWVFKLREWASYDQETDPIGADYLRLGALMIDRALDQGLPMTPEPMPLYRTPMVSGDAEYTWKKPVLVLADELAGSCGDIFPMLMQSGGTAKIFGERTMGLGGNVETVITLPNSQASVRLTRGLFVSYKADGVYESSDIVENNGITPDIPYRSNLADFRGGYVEYLKAASAAAVAQIPQAE